jgi:tetratricopeptide (TPR) repeat protein
MFVCTASYRLPAAGHIDGIENPYYDMDHGQLDSAIQSLAYKHFKKPAHPDYILHLAEAYTAMDNIDSAVAYWGLLSAVQPGNSTARYAQAQLYYAVGKLDSTAASIQKALAIAPDDAAYLSLSALTAYRLQKHDEAFALCNKILFQSPVNANALLLSGIILRDEKKDTAALERFDRCLKADPASTEALLHRADEYVLLKRYTDALRDYSAARADLSGNADILNNIGICHYQSGAYRQAIIYFKKAISHNHLQPQSYFNKGLSYYHLNSIDSASIDIKTASAIWDTCCADTCHASFLDAIYYLGMCYKKVGDLPAARSHFELLQKEKYPKDLSAEIRDIDRALFISRSWYYFLLLIILILAWCVAMYRLMKRR